VHLFYFVSNNNQNQSFYFILFNNLFSNVLSIVFKLKK
jgi:hypothetical protein